MTDAEPAFSPEAQVQVKFRPGIQVTAPTSFPLCFFPKVNAIIFRLLPLIQDHDAGENSRCA
jgi:hypothetical protein